MQPCSQALPVPLRKDSEPSIVAVASAVWWYERPASCVLQGNPERLSPAARGMRIHAGALMTLLGFTLLLTGAAYSSAMLKQPKVPYGISVCTVAILTNMPPFKPLPIRFTTLSLCRSRARNSN